MTVGDRMRKRRIELGLSQEEVSIKLGYKSRSSVNKMECSRNLPLSKIEEVAKVLDCSPAFLMGWEEAFTPETAILHAHMTEDSQFTDLYKIWIHLNDTGKQKLMDNANDLVQIYKKE